jgi:hypothetical protein
MLNISLLLTTLQLLKALLLIPGAKEKENLVGMHLMVLMFTILLVKVGMLLISVVYMTVYNQLVR